MDSTKLSSEKIEFATVGRTKKGEIYHHLWSAEEIDALLKEHDLAKKDDGATGVGSDKTPSAANAPGLRAGT